MATLLRTTISPPSLSTITPLNSSSSSSSPPPPSSSYFCVNFRNTSLCYPRNSCLFSNHLVSKFSRLPYFVVSAASSSGETAETDHQTDVQDNKDEPVIDESSEDVSSDDEKSDADVAPASPLLTALHLYKESVNNNDEAKIAELEAYFKSIEDEKNALERKVLSLSEEFSVERERVLRISADFDNFRKRTERERLSLVTNAQGELVEKFLPVIDNFERAKSQIKVETEAEEKINNSYQSIYKQFFEIIGSIGVIPVETVGKAFDPLLHEAIMREESTEYEEDIIIEEYRKGFKLGDRLLRPSMVKVSAGPGPKKPETSSETTVEEEDATETTEVVDVEDDSTDETTS